MRKSKQPTKPSRRLNKRDEAKPPPLRFTSVKDAKAHIKANKLKVVNHVTHTRGARINVVDPKGHPRTIRIEISKESNGKSE